MEAGYYYEKMEKYYYGLCNVCLVSAQPSIYRRNRSSLVNKNVQTGGKFHILVLQWHQAPPFSGWDTG